jgi:hypothetical protein
VPITGGGTTEISINQTTAAEKFNYAFYVFDTFGLLVCWSAALII